ncbi:MAG TPA: hypothetical protein PK536_07000 [Ignavibacteria bacterium]|nr:hypothetical protein [Bacteroidota bacterium]HRI85179.1 hypothetical protein [Ignavibacteria bacterium]HRK00610.1 hypothetical protein [Ignavibacteria bacterium]
MFSQINVALISGTGGKMIKISEILENEKILFLSNIGTTGAIDSEERKIEDRISEFMNNKDKLFSVCSINLKEINLERSIFAGAFGVGLTEGEIITASKGDMGYSKDIEDITLKHHGEIISIEQFMEIMKTKSEDEHNEVLIKAPKVSYLYAYKLYNMSINEFIGIAKSFCLPVYHFDSNNTAYMKYPESKEVDIDFINSYNLKPK